MCIQCVCLSVCPHRGQIVKNWELVVTSFWINKSKIPHKVFNVILLFQHMSILFHLFILFLKLNIYQGKIHS